MHLSLKPQTLPVLRTKKTRVHWYNHVVGMFFLTINPDPSTHTHRNNMPASDDNIVVVPFGQDVVETEDDHHLKTIPSVFEGIHSAFKMCVPTRTSLVVDTMSKQGASFYAVFPTNIPRVESDFNNNDYLYTSPYMVQPIAPGIATAPYEYARGSKKTKEQLFTFNKSGQPLTAWADSSQSNMRFWGYEKKGYNRGNRVENLTWTYGGGHCMDMTVNLKDIQPQESDGNVPFFHYGPTPDAETMMSFDLVRVMIMPRNDEALRKDRKTCFTLKGVASTTRSLASVLPHLRSSMHKSKEDAEAEAAKIIRGEDPYRDSKNELLPYAHQIKCMPPKDDKENYTAAEVTSCAFLQENVGPDTTFMYDDHSKVIRMCIKPTGCSPFMVDMPVCAVLKNANAKKIHDACGLYTLAANCPGALCAFVYHDVFWGKKLWDEDCGYGDPTPFRGTPIIDASKLLTPLCHDEFYLLNPVVTGEGNKSRLEVDLGFKMQYNPSLESGDKGGDMMDDDDTIGAGGQQMIMCPVHAEVRLCAISLMVAGILCIWIPTCVYVVMRCVMQVCCIHIFSRGS